MVSWKDAADMNESVAKEALVIPSKTLSNSAGLLPLATALAFSSFNSA